MVHPELGPARQIWFEEAVSLIDEERMHRLAFDLTGIHSPTGRERAASEFMVARLTEAGLAAWYQPMGEASGNAAARLRGSGGGPSLLLYSPIDTHLEAEQETDIPWVGPGLRQDMIPEPVVRGELIIGLGAANPKAMVVTLAESARVIAEAGIPLTGDLLVAFAGGGMPVDLAAPGNRGLSDGVFHLLTRGVYADFALVMKPGNAVYHEEPGLCWFKVSVKGTMGYAGLARGVPGFRSSIVPAATVIAELEEWLPGYAERNSSGQVMPHGWVAAVRGGWPDRVAFPSATTEIYLDIRCNPRTPPAEVAAQFGTAIDDVRARHPDFRLRLGDDRLYSRRKHRSGELGHQVRDRRLGGGRRAPARVAAPDRRTDRYFDHSQSRHPDRKNRLGEHARGNACGIPRGFGGHGGDSCTRPRTYLPQAGLLDHRHLHPDA